MSIRNKSLLIVVVTLVFVIGVLYLTSYIVLTRSYQTIENELVIGSMRRVIRTFDSHSKSLLNTASDWAYWDETYQFVQDKNSTYIDDNLSFSSIAALDLSIIAFYDSADTLVFYRATDLENGVFIDWANPPDQWLHIHHDLTHCTNDLNQYSGIIQTEIGPLMVATSPILTNESTGPCMGTLLIGRLLDRGFMTEISDQTDASVSIIPYADVSPDPHITESEYQQLISGEITHHVHDQKTVEAYRSLPDPSGDPIYLLRAEIPRYITIQGRNTLRYFLWVLIALGVLVTLSEYLLINHFFLARFTSLNRDLQNIIHLRNPKNRLPEDKNEDEISALVNGINSTLDTLEEVQSGYRILVENQEEGLVIVDEKENVLFANPAVNTFFGVKDGTLVGKNILSFLDWKDAARVRSQTRERTTGIKGKYEITVNPETGPARIYHISAAPRFDHNNRYIGSYAVFRDITEVKQAREKLETSERRFRSLVEQSRLGIFLLDGDGGIIEWNRSLEAMTGLKKADLLGRPFHEIPFWIMVDERRIELVKEKMPQLFNFMVNGDSENYFNKPIEINYEKTTGGNIVAELSLFPVRSDGKSQIGGIINEITEQKRMEKAEEDQRVFLAALRDTSEALNSDLDFESLLDRILVNAERVIPSVTGAVLLVDGEMLRVVRSRGYAEKGLPDLTQHKAFPLKEMQNMLWMSETGRPMAISDTRLYPDWNPLPENTWVRSYIGMPLMVRQRTIGFLSLFSNIPGFYTEDHAERLAAFASQTATAIENARLYSEVQQKADTDELTGLRNRRSLFELGSREVERAVRFKYPLSILMIDLDYFKQVNDNFGHPVGDRLLVALADQFRHNLRNVDLIGRYGGDEFIALLPENDLEHALIIARRLMKAINDAKIETAHGKASVGASIGVATLSGETTTLSGLIEKADQALYKAKEAGRGLVVSANSSEH